MKVEEPSRVQSHNIARADVELCNVLEMRSSPRVERKKKKKRNNGIHGWASSVFNVARVHRIVTAS